MEEEETKECKAETALKEEIECKDDVDVACDEGDATVEMLNFKILFNKTLHQISWDSQKSIASLKDHVETLTDVPAEMQKLMYKGLLKDSQSLTEANISNGTKVMLIGSQKKDIVSANKKVKVEVAKASSSTVKKEPLCEQKQHKKIIDQGVPDDAMPAYRNGHEPLPEVALFGMKNKVGHKARLTFKLESDEVWISTKERTQKVQMTSIRSVVSEPIKGKEEYHLMGFAFGTTEQSRYWIYWVPAQYVKAIKNTVMGL